VKNFFVCCGYRDNALARCDLIFPLLRCQGVWNKWRTQLSLSHILFQNPKNYSRGDVQRFCYPSSCDSMVIFDQISNRSNVYLSSSRLWTATSLVIFYQLPLFSKLRMPPKNVWLVQSLIPISLFSLILVFLSQIDRLWNKILRQLSVYFHHPRRIKQTDFTKQVIIRTLSKINKRNSVCERMLVDST
jgi:hypothetical protein